MYKKLVFLIAIVFSIILGFSQNHDNLETDAQRRQALAKVSNQKADPETGRMGYKVLDPGLSFAEQVTEINTIYEIRDVFDLGGKPSSAVKVNIPDNCILKFNGGAIKNGTLNFVGSFSIEHNFTKVFYNCLFSGKILEYVVPVELFVETFESSFNAKSTLDASDEFNDMFANGFICFSFTKPRYYHIKHTIKINGVIKTYGNYSSNLDYSTWPGYENAGNACIYSNSITTLIDYNFDGTAISLSQLVLRGFELFCNKDYTDLSENDTPILYIHNKTAINSGVIELNIKSKIKMLNAGNLIKGAKNVNTNIATRTGIRLEAQYNYISLVTIKGNIEYVRTGIKAVCNKTHNEKNWFTDIKLDAFTRCAYGIVSDAYPVTVSNSHQTLRSLSVNNTDAYITAKTVYLHGKVWDVGINNTDANVGPVKYAYASDEKQTSDEQPFKKLTNPDFVKINELQNMMNYDNILNHIIDDKNVISQVENVSFTAKFSTTLNGIEETKAFNPTIDNNNIGLSNITRIFGPSIAKRISYNYYALRNSDACFAYSKSGSGYCKYNLSFTMKSCCSPAKESYIIVYATENTSNDTDIKVKINDNEYTIQKQQKRGYYALVIPLDLSSNITFNISWIDYYGDTYASILFPTIYIPNVGTNYRLPSLNKSQYDNAYSNAGGFGKDLVFVSDDDANNPINRLAIMNGTSKTDRQKIGVDGRKFGYLAGESSRRPTNLENISSDIGYMFYDISLGKLITWNGLEWENTDGTPLLIYTITNKMTRVTTNNNTKSIDGNKTYLATLTPTKGYTISSITITMGGTDITSFVFDEKTGVVYIPSVIGDIVITAMATIIPK